MSNTPIHDILRDWTGPKFWKRVRQDDAEACWIFPGTKTPGGYGVVQISYDYKAIKFSVLAHRLAWVLHNDCEIPKGFYVCHRCNNRACCNPAHLYAGAPSDNSRDTVRSGNGGRGKAWLGKTGTQHPRCKYSDEQHAWVIELRKKGMPWRRVRYTTGVSVAACSRIWKNHLATAA